MRDPASRVHRAVLPPVMIAAAMVCARPTTVRADNHPLPDWKPISSTTVFSKKYEKADPPSNFCEKVGS
jgi:hypothetical protein